MKSKTYSEKTIDPRWQKKRLEVLNRDEFTCQCCFDNQTELHVHHLIYNFNKDPWEIENELLLTVCKECHEKFTEANKLIKISISKIKDCSVLTDASKVIEMMSYFNPDIGDLLIEYMEALMKMDYKYKKALSDFFIAISNHKDIDF